LNKGTKREKGKRGMEKGRRGRVLYQQEEGKERDK
jgi:hypothetical protein